MFSRHFFFRSSSYWRRSLSYPSASSEEDESLYPSTLVASCSSEDGEGFLAFRSFPPPDFFLKSGSEASLDFCASVLGGGAVEVVLFSVAPAAVIRDRGAKLLLAEHLLAAPSSFQYFLTLLIAFMANAEAAHRSLSALSPS